jgi:hypothetical protein
MIQLVPQKLVAIRCAENGYILETYVREQDGLTAKEAIATTFDEAVTRLYRHLHPENSQVVLKVLEDKDIN